MEYWIVFGYDNAEVSKLVNEKLGQGWQLQGNLAVGFSIQQSCAFLAQAMVRAKPAEVADIRLAGVSVKGGKALER